MQRGSGPGQGKRLRGGRAAARWASGCEVGPTKRWSPRSVMLASRSPRRTPEILCDSLQSCQRAQADARSTGAHRRGVNPRWEASVVSSSSSSSSSSSCRGSIGNSNRSGMRQSVLRSLRWHAVRAKGRQAPHRGGRGEEASVGGGAEAEKGRTSSSRLAWGLWADGRARAQPCTEVEEHGAESRLSKQDERGLTKEDQEQQAQRMCRGGRGFRPPRRRSARQAFEHSSAACLAGGQCTTHVSEAPPKARPSHFFHH